MEWLKKNRDKILLLLLLLLTAFLAGYKIWDEGNANAYYTATVKSMLTSWHNFFYASFDPGGFITVDKPALGFWLQCLFGLVFGVHGWSLILPEVICSVISVAVLHHIVKRSFGEGAGLLAALFLALTPIFIAATRTDNLDASLVMVCLFAVWAVIVAAEKGSLKHLLLAMALLGLGFNIKMLQAYLYLPALGIVYFFTAQTKISKRIIHLAVSAVVLVAVSLSWCVAVDLTPPEDRPYVGSSATNTELGLVIGYNGIARALGTDTRIVGDTQLESIIGADPAIPNEGGESGLLRLVNYNMAGQASWLLVPAVLGIAALVMKLLSKKDTDKKAALRQLIMWSALFLPMYVYFSITGHFHRYYLIMFTPCLAALGAIAVTEFLKFFACDQETGRNNWRNVLLPLTVLLTAAAQVYILTAYYTAYAKILVPAIAAGAGLSAVGLVLVKLRRKENSRAAVLAVTVGLLGLLAAPAYWAYSPIAYEFNAAIPVAGPPGTTEGGSIRIFNGGLPNAGGFGPGGQVGQPPKQDGHGNPAVGFPGKSHTDGVPNHETVAMGQIGFGQSPSMAAAYMMKHYNGARFLVAVLNSAQAEPFILQYGVGVMTMGGFKGTDDAISLEDFKALVEKGELQYFWVSGIAFSDITKWVLANGVKVDDAQWSVPGMPSGTLYDLSGLKK